jgi:hypothetical protein
MKMPVTQFWDSRLLYIYALLSGFIEADEKTLQQQLDDFINTPANKAYCSEVLEKLESEAKISLPLSNVNSKWFRDMVSSYLEDFQSDQIFAPTGRSITLYKQHETRLLNKLGTSPALREIDGNQSSNSKKFLETIFAMTNKGLLVIESVKPSDESCMNYIAKVRRTNQTPATGEATATAKVDGTQVFVGIEGEELLPLGKPLRFEGAAYNFMHYMQTHTNQLVSKLDIQELDNCHTKVDMTEMVRQCHFDKQLKKIFFEGTTKTGVRFSATRKLTGNELKVYNLRLDTIRS